MQKMNMKEVQNVASTHDLYVAVFGVGDVFTRREFVEHNALPYSTVVYNLERAVSAGKLNKAKLLVRGMPTWVYALPETMPQLPGIEGIS